MKRGLAALKKAKTRNTINLFIRLFQCRLDQFPCQFGMSIYNSFYTVTGAALEARSIYSFLICREMPAIQKTLNLRCYIRAITKMNTTSELVVS